eukprot:gene6229-7759_t
MRITKVPKIFVVVFILVIISLFTVVYFSELNSIYTSFDTSSSKSSSGSNSGSKRGGKGQNKGGTDTKTLPQQQTDEDGPLLFLWNSNSIESDWTGYLKDSQLHSEVDINQNKLLKGDNAVQDKSSEEYDNSNKKIISKDGYVEEHPDNQCQVTCRFTNNENDLPYSQMVMFDPTYLHKQNWRREPITIPERLPHQKFLMMHYTSDSQYPIITNPEYNKLMDHQISYYPNSSLPISLACPPSPAYTLKETVNLLMNQLSHKDKPKNIAFLSSNCKDGFASARTAYVEELSRYITIDSYGSCLSNSKIKDFPTRTQVVNINNVISKNMELFSEYKFAITFENENRTDYVTEKVYSALFSGAIPIYMGAPNIEDWVPTGSIINANKFKSPKELSHHIRDVLNDQEEMEKYFAWKKKPLEKKVIDKLSMCVNSYRTKCKLCELAHSLLSETERHYQLETFPTPQTVYQPYFIQMTGKGDHIAVKDNCGGCFNLDNHYTFMVWIKPSSYSDQRIIDKNQAGEVSGYNFDLQKTIHSAGFARLCAGLGCYESTRRLSTDVWYHVAVVYSTNNLDVHKNRVTFFINGEEDISHESFTPTNHTKFPLLIGKISSIGDVDSGTYHGYLDNLMIFNRSLEQKEIKKYIWSKPYGDEEGLILFYDFDVNMKDRRADRSLIRDKSKYGNNGVLSKGNKNDHSHMVLSYGKEVSFNKCL